MLRRFCCPKESDVKVTHEISKHETNSGICFIMWRAEETSREMIVNEATNFNF